MQYFYVLILDHETLLNLFVGSISCLEDFLEFCAKKDNFPSSVLILIPTFFFFSYLLSLGRYSSAKFNASGKNHKCYLVPALCGRTSALSMMSDVSFS
jgi:hypothetical protein